MAQCKQCKLSFEILDQDRQFYDMMQVPEPTLCYLCRMQRRLSFRSERFLYHRKCDLTGKQIISTYSVDKPFPVYQIDEWLGDRFEPLAYGRDFDFSRPFFEQFFDLRDTVPRRNLIQEKPMENSDYCNTVGRLKNCYLCFSCSSDEDCYYNSWVNFCKNCVDNKSVHHSELCYECVDCRDCFNLKYSQNCTNCKESYFLRNCQGCRDCLGCSNLINKQYYLFNKPQTKQQYENFFKEIDVGSYSVINKITERIDGELADLVVKEYEGLNNINSVGNYLRNNKNAYVCFDSEECEDIRYSQSIVKAKNSMDHSHWGEGTENIYECQAVGFNCTNMRFCNLNWSGCSDMTYCDHCFSSKNSFGCVSLKRNEYCILNKQYSKAEYHKMMVKIVEHMKKTGEWGEFFPAKNAPYAYNETMAHEDIPLTREEVLERGWKWKDDIAEKNYKGPIYDIPDNIKDVEDDITKHILLSEPSKIPYKVVPQELAYYREQTIPIPRLTPDERHWERLKKRNPRMLWDRKCVKCGLAIRTSYSPERPEKVYCEKCYLTEVY